MEKKLKLRKVIATLCISTLVDLPFVLAEEKEKLSEDERQSENIERIGNGAIKIWKTYNDNKVQILQMQNNANLLAKLGPGCMQNGRPCHLTPAKYFPECTITNSLVNFPQNMCESPSMDPGQVGMMSSYKQLAQNWVNQFDHMLNLGQNSSIPVGLKCLEDKKLALGQQLKNTINSLTALQNQLKRDQQIFRENNKAILSEIEKNNSELFGGAQSNAEKTRNLSNYFSPNCQNVIGTQALQEGSAKGGLTGILQNMTPVNRDAGNFLQNKNAIEADIRRSVEKMNSKTKEDGLISLSEAYPDQQSLEKEFKYPSVRDAISEKLKEFKATSARIATQLKEIQPGYTLPAMDKNFSIDTEEFISGAKDYFKKEYINDCVTGKESGVAIPLDKVLEALSQKSTGNGGTARDKYRAALKAIVESDTTIDDKLARIKNLESLYSDITVTYQNNQAQRVTQTPYDLYMQTVAACEQKYTQNNMFSTGSARSVSQQKKVDRAVNLIRDYKNLNDTFTAKLSAAITEKVLSCSGEAKKTGNKACTEAIKTDSPNFCIAHANECAGEIQACFIEADKQVKVREQKNQLLSKKYNENVAQVVARSNQLYQQQQNTVQSLVGYLQQRFPGTQFDLPKDMFLEAPSLAKGKFGVDLLGGGDQKFLEELPNKIDKFKEMLTSQTDSIIGDNGLFVDYINKQKQAMEEQKQKWAGLADKCDGVYKNSMAQINEMNQKAAEAEAKATAAAGQFCKKFGALKKNPLPNCSKSLSDLYENVGKAGAEAYVNDGALEVAGTLKDLCDEHQAEISEAKKAMKESKISYVDLCTQVKLSDEDFVAALKNKMGLDIKIPEGKKLSEVISNPDNLSNGKPLTSAQKSFLSKLSKQITSDGAGKPICEATASGDEKGSVNARYADAEKSLESVINEAKLASASSNPIQDKLRRIGEESKGIECDATADNGRNILKDLFSTPTSLQKLGIGSLSQ